MSINPYESPLEAAVLEEASDEEVVRRAHLNHESNIKSIGTLYYIGAALMFTMAVLFPLMEKTVSSLGISAIFAAIGGAYFGIGYGVRRFHPWARFVAAALATLGLIGFPIGTAIGLVFLYFLLSKKGTFVFSKRYAQIRAATPHLDKRHKTSPLVMILAGLLLLLLLLAIIGAVVEGY